MPVGSVDGHTAATTKELKTSEDETFHFAFTWLESPSWKGWTVHYRPKHSSASAEIDGIFKFLGINAFSECPEFDFSECYWRFIPFQQQSDLDPFGGNANWAHGVFDAHGNRFSPGIEKLLRAHSLMEKAGLKLLPFADSYARHRKEIQQRVIQSTKAVEPIKRAKAETFDFDVAISFAGSNRMEAEELAIRVRDAGFSVFYDDFYPEELWGKDLTVFFDEIYRKRSRYCLILASEEYLERPWTIHERRSAMARALKERGGEYILPIKVNGVELPGLPPTIGYILMEKGINKIAEVLIRKLK